MMEFSNKDEADVATFLPICDVGIIVSDENQGFNENSEVSIPATLPRVKFSFSQFSQSSEVFFLAFEYATKPFEGLDQDVKEKLLRNRKNKKSYFFQTLALIGSAGLIGFVLFKKFRN